MKEKIREIFKDYEVTHGGLVLVAEEIASMMEWFVAWTLQSVEHIPYSDANYIMGSGLEDMTLEQLFDYWYKNVYKK